MTRNETYTGTHAASMSANDDHEREDARRTDRRTHPRMTESFRASSRPRHPGAYRHLQAAPHSTARHVVGRVDAGKGGGVTEGWRGTGGREQDRREGGRGGCGNEGEGFTQPSLERKSTSRGNAARRRCADKPRSSPRARSSFLSTSSQGWWLDRKGKFFFSFLSVFFLPLPLFSSNGNGPFSAEGEHGNGI